MVLMRGQNIIAPGIYPSEMTTGTRGDDNRSSLEDKVYPKESIPSQRAGREEEIGGIVLFLTGKVGGYLNGNVLVTDGGRLSIWPSTY